MGMTASLMDGLDRICEITVGGFRPRGVVISILVHSVFLEAAEADSPHVQSQQALTVTDLDVCIKEFRQIGFEFIAPDGVSDQLADKGRYVWLTFDDGYSNNLRALPLLERYKIPATFYIASGFVNSGEGFWQDTLHRELRARGASREAIRKVISELRSKKHSEIRSTLKERFGPHCLTPKVDIARPLNPEELKRLAESPWARIGNHTRDHEILAHRSLEEARFQIEACQDDLSQILGRAPKVFAYPSGRNRTGVATILRDLGFELALTTTAGKNSVKALQDDRMCYGLKRYLLWGNRDIASQVRSFTSSVRPSDFARSIRDRLSHRHIY